MFFLCIRRCSICLITRDAFTFFCIDWPMLGLRLRDASATEISDPSSKSACSQQQKCLRKQPWGHTSHNMKLATNNVAHFNFGSPLQTFAPISPMSSYQPATMTPWHVLPHPGGRALHLRLTQQLPHLWVVGPWMKVDVLQYTLKKIRYIYIYDSYDNTLVYNVQLQYMHV